MTKQEVIKKAYGKYYDLCKPYLRGHLIDRVLFEDETGKKLSDLTDVEFLSDGIVFSLPMELNGFEDNNGWVKIESEKDLPDYQGTLIAIKKSDTEVYEVHFFNYLKEGEKEEWAKIFSHYRLIPNFKAPIY